MPQMFDAVFIVIPCDFYFMIAFESCSSFTMIKQKDELHKMCIYFMYKRIYWNLLLFVKLNQYSLIVFYFKLS